MKAFIITTLDNKQARSKNVEQIGIESALTYEIVIAPDWRIFKHTSLNPEQYKQQSLTLAYYNICLKAMYLEPEQFVIFEDDAHITDSELFFEKGLELRRLMAMYDKIKFAYLSRTDHNIESAHVRDEFESYGWQTVVANYWETPATLWTLDMAKIFVEYISKKLEQGLWLGHIDHELQKIMIEQKLTYLCPKDQFIVGLSSYKTPPVEFDRTGSISGI